VEPVTFWRWIAALGWLAAIGVTYEWARLVFAILG
jgi:hypothetical protein